MKLVIEIDEAFYDLIQDTLDFNGDLSRADMRKLMLSVDMGKPLPKNYKIVSTGLMKGGFYDKN